MKYSVYILLLIWGGILYILGYNIYHFNHTENEIAVDPVEDKAEKLEQEYHFLIPLFNQVIENEKIFLQKNLHLEDLAKTIHTNRTYISRLINEEYQSSFSDFINKKRIEYAQELMLSQPQLTQEEIADKSGFIHSSSFSRTFKQLEGITFREWRKKFII